MNAATLAFIYEAITLGIKAAPAVSDFIKRAKTFVMSLFSTGLITADQQAALMTYCDAAQAAALAGDPPPAWTVEPDPV